ncbi:MAG TPA: rhombosortase [Burkholderiaceae bacterium]
MGLRLRLSGRAAWLTVAALLAGLSLICWFLPTHSFDWQPALAAREPWRAFTAAGVHWSLRHLLANLAGCAVLAWLGWRADLPWRAAVAWALAWPLTQLGLLARPELLHYGGLSGVLHAGVAVLVVELLVARRTQRIGAALAAGLLLKLGLEAGWGPALQQPAGLDFAVAPCAHLSGAIIGVLLAVAARRASGPSRHTASKGAADP